MDNEKKVMRLLDKSRKGILRFLFSRAVFISVLIILQFVLLYFIFNSYFRWLTTFQYVFTVIMVLYIFNDEMDATAKMTWFLILVVAPIPASIALVYTKTDFGKRRIHERIEELNQKTKTLLTQDPLLLMKTDIISSGTDDLRRYLNLSGNFPIYDKTAVKYYQLGDDMHPDLLEDIRNAKKFIYLEYFIIAEGYMWGSVLQLLTEKVKEGVDVRVMYDGMLEISTLSPEYPRMLKELGIKCKPISPIHPLISTTYNYRDHRKIAVIDNIIAYTGGVNLADEYINRIERFGHWKDAAIRLQGAAVASFCKMFLQMWNMDEINPDFNPCLLPCPDIEASGYVLPYSDCPLDKYMAGETVYMDILNRAKNYVHIMTPYLILDNKLENALTYASERGIDVKIILPGIPDKKIPYALAKSHYKHLIDAGISIYEYTPGFVHSKVFVSDDEKAVVGTINLDYRSLYHHYECAAYLYQTDCIKDIEKDFQKTLHLCKRVTYESIRNEKFLYKLAGRVVKLIAPLL